MADIIVGKEYSGVLVPATVPSYYDPKYMGRYLIHIAELMPHKPEDEGIWCKNHVHKNRMTRSSVGTYGSYMPLHAGTKVIIKFYENDWQTGYVDRIISDYEENTTWEAQDNEGTIPDEKDRDEQYILLKTPKKWNILYVNEDTKNEPNTIYLVFNRDDENLKSPGEPGRRTVYRVDESGIHTWTRDNQRVRIWQDDNKQVSGDQTEYVEGYRTKHVDGDEDVHLHSKRRWMVDDDEHHHIGGNKTSLIDKSHDHKTEELFTGEIVQMIDFSCGGITNQWSTGDINIDSGSNINLNCGIFSYLPANEPDDPKPKTFVRDLGPRETAEYDESDSDNDGRPIVVGDKCDEETTKYVMPGENPAGDSDKKYKS